MKTILVEVDLKGAPEAIRNIDGLENAISSLEDELKQASFGSEEFKKLSKELTKARSELKNTELALEALDSEQVASEFGSLTGAVGDVSGAFLLLGGEDGSVAQSVEKIQTAIGVSMAFKGAIEGLSSGRKLLNNFLATNNTLQKINNAGTVAATGIYKLFGKTVDTTSKSFKGLRTAIIATGIGALVVGVGLLIANWDKLTKALSSTTAEQDAYNEASKKAIESIGGELLASNDLQKTLKDETLTREQKVKAVQDLQAEYPFLLSNVDAEKDGLNAVSEALKLNTELLILKAKQEAVIALKKEKYTEELKEQIDLETGANKGVFESVQAFALRRTGIAGDISAQELSNLKTKESTKAIKEEIDVLSGLEKSLQSQIDAKLELGGSDEKTTKEAEERAKKASEAAKARAIKRKAERIKEANDKKAIADKEAKDELDRLKRIEDNEKAHKQTLIDIENEFRAELETETDLYNKQFISEQEFEIQAVQDKYFRLIELAEQYGEDTSVLKFNQASAEAEINKKFAEQELATNEKFAKEELDNNRQLQEQKLTIANDALGAINGLVQAFAKEDEESAKKAFNVNKAVGIAQAIMSTAQGVINAYANPIDVASGVAFAKSAIIAATGAAQIAVISKTKFESPEQAPPSPPSGDFSGGTGATTQPPAFNVVGQSGFNQIAGALGQQPPVQAFVVSQDVTTAQQLNNAIIQTATF
jgi:hypothetical protein